MMQKIIETFDLTKIYKLKGQNKEIKALDKVNLSIKKGEIFGLLGPNGAGKTTLMHILTTIKQPTSGYATINGYNILKNPKQAKNNLALMLESKMLYYRITGYDNLRFFCKIYKVQNYKEKIIAMAKDFGLEKWLQEFVENYSSGMKMKLALLRTLLLNRNILFLDEPTVGMDVETKRSIINIIKDTNKTIFLTSHDMNVVDQLCDRIAFINKGKILKIGKKDDLKNIMKSEINIDIEIYENKKILISELKQQDYVNEISLKQNGIIVNLDGRKYYKNFLQILSKYNVLKVSELELELEDLFVKMIY